jgi:MraZ protein
MAKMWDNVGMLMSGFFFSGSNYAKIDEKGRFVLPQEMRYGLVEDGKCEFVIGLGLGGCLAIYRKSAIEKIVERFRKMQHVAQYQKFFTLFFSTLHPTECDKVGRVSLPATLKKAIGIKKDVVVAGVMDKIEIWPKEVYERNLRELLEETSPDLNLAKMTEEAFALLNEAAIPVQPSSPVPTAALNPLYFAAPTKV